MDVQAIANWISFELAVIGVLLPGLWWLWKMQSRVEQIVRIGKETRAVLDPVTQLPGVCQRILDQVDRADERQQERCEKLFALIHAEKQENALEHKEVVLTLRDIRDSLRLKQD